MNGWDFFYPLAEAYFNKQQKKNPPSFLFRILKSKRDLDECSKKIQTYWVSRAAVNFAEASRRWPDTNSIHLRDSLIKWLEEDDERSL